MFQTDPNSWEITLGMLFINPVDLDNNYEAHLLSLVLRTPTGEATEFHKHDALHLTICFLWHKSISLGGEGDFCWSPPPTADFLLYPVLFISFADPPMNKRGGVSELQWEGEMGKSLPSSFILLAEQVRIQINFSVWKFQYLTQDLSLCTMQLQSSFASKLVQDYH